MHQPQSGAGLQCIPHTHVTTDPRSAGGVVNGDQAIPSRVHAGNVGEGIGQHSSRHPGHPFRWAVDNVGNMVEGIVVHARLHGKNVTV